MPTGRSPSTQPAEAAARIADAERCLAAGRLDDAAALCRSVLAEAPDSAPAVRLLGIVLVLQGGFAEARRLLEPVASTHGGDPDVQLALAEALWGAESPAAALPRFEAARALAPDRPRLRLRLGQALLAAGDPAAARAELEIAFAGLPGSAVAATALARAEAATGAAEAAIAHAETALALAPEDDDAPFQLGQILRALGRLDAAIAALREGVRRAPASALLRVALGDALHAARRHDAAFAELREAVRLAPEWALAWTALGRTVQRLGRLDEALTYFRTARRLDHGMPELDAIIGNALIESGALAEAHAHFARSMAHASWTHAEARRRERMRIGVLLAPGAHNTPTQFILDPASYDLELVFMLDDFDYPHARMTASYDVLFNAIGDADRAHGALARACDVVAAVGLPVVNAPREILATTRERMALRLASIDGCMMPPTHRGTVASLRESAARDGLDALGWPILVRPVGSHGGTDLVKCDTPAALAACLDAMTAADVYVTRFCDFRSPDGRYRKYRFIVVAGDVLPYHLAFGDTWLVHYFRTDMASQPALLDEEARFLADPLACLGPAAGAALAEIARRVPLDFFGLDCALDPTGRLVVFECNAAMLVHDADPSPAFDFKRAPVERIRQAVTRMLTSRGRSTVL